MQHSATAAAKKLSFIDPELRPQQCSVEPH